MGDKETVVNEMDLLALSTKIEKSFKSLIKSGRPDIRDEHNEDLVHKLYVDLYEGEYILNQVLDDNHTLLKGRKGTGKSTVFLQAENRLKNEKYKMSIYINLQSCYEEIRTSNADDTDDKLTCYRTYANFFTEILNNIKKSINKIFRDKEIEKLFEEISNGEYIDADFKRNFTVTENTDDERSASSAAALESGKLKTEFNLKHNNKQQNTSTKQKNELRIFSINKILNKIKEILYRHKIKKVYLFLDDFSELSYENQKLIIDSLISPIISSYNEVFTVKLAAYPHRIYLGQIDSSKMVTHSLDFYDVYEQSSQKYSQVEDAAIDYVKRTLEKRIEVYTQNQLNVEDIFDTTKVSIDVYFKTLFYASAGIPRALGYILTYSYLSSINKGRPITIANINAASKKYFNDNLLPDFYNDARFKQSFYDDKDILNQLAQKNLLDDIIKKQKSVKRDIIELYTKSKKDCKKIYIDTLDENKKSTGYWVPTSHFYMDKDIECILQTLELYFLVNKFNEGSSRTPGKRVCYFGLNYGLCLENNIDYGRPEFRRTYDYWRQEEFNLTEFIPNALSSIEVPICSKCNYEYTDQNEYKMYEKFGCMCLNCHAVDSVVKVNKFNNKFEEKVKSWRDISLPDLYIDILRVLYNNRDKRLTAYEIGLQLDKHHLTITKAMDKLKEYKYVSYTVESKRYYKIEEIAIAKFFKQ